MITNREKSLILLCSNDYKQRKHKENPVKLGISTIFREEQSRRLPECSEAETPSQTLILVQGGGQRI